MISESRGILKATSALDRETAPIRRLWIEASDGDYPPLSVLTPIDIIVEDANDNDPEFEKVGVGSVQKLKFGLRLTPRSCRICVCVLRSSYLLTRFLCTPMIGFLEKLKRY